MSRIAGLIRRTFGIVREHVGTDHLGNKYYFIPQQKTWTGRSVRAKRIIEMANSVEYEYVGGSIPKEWEAWIQGKRKQPPSVEELSRTGVKINSSRSALMELLKNEYYMKQIKLKAKELEEKDLALQAKEYEEGLVATPVNKLAKGHAATTTFGKEDISEDPTSSGNTFQPGSWMPKS